MALILPDSRCAICGHRVQDEPFRGFPHFAGPYDAFARYSDAAVHERCFDAAPEKDTIEWLLARRFPGGD